MCYGMNCQYEDSSGECRRPLYTHCPQDEPGCDANGRGYWEDDDREYEERWIAEYQKTNQE